MIEVTCAHCGKSFILAPQHALRDGKGFYCKPTCFLHRNDNVKKPCGSGRKASKVAKYTKAGDLVQVYESAKEAERLEGYDAKGIMSCIYNKKPYKGFMWEYID